MFAQSFASYWLKDNKIHKNISWVLCSFPLKKSIHQHIVLCTGGGIRGRYQTDRFHFGGDANVRFPYGRRPSYGRSYIFIKCTILYYSWIRGVSKSILLICVCCPFYNSSYLRDIKKKKKNNFRHFYSVY